MIDERTESILLSLKHFDFLTVEQIRKMHDLKSRSNTYRMINKIKPYVHVFKEGGVNVHYLNKEGREAVSCDKVRYKTSTVKHYLMRNDLYIHLQHPEGWKNEMRIRYEGNDPITVVADAHFKTDRHYIVEVDNEQKMQKNRQKVDKYRRLIEKNAFDGNPGFIWITTTEHRREVLNELCDGLKFIILTHSEIS